MTRANDSGLYLLLLAAGSGRRFATGQNKKTIPKQYHKIGPKTVIEHSLEAFSTLKLKAAMVTVEADDKHWSQLTLSLPLTIHTTPGGQQRVDSVRLGLQALKEIGATEQDWVLVHDAARCCVTSAEILRLIDQCLKVNQGGLLVNPVADTVKWSKNGETVEKTLDREHIYLALTPQMFRLGALESALDQAEQATDEAAAMEATGASPIMVKGDISNVKLTDYNQLPVIEAYLQRQGRL